MTSISSQGGDSLDRAPAYRIYRLSRLMRHRLQIVLNEHGNGISPEQYFALFRLYKRDGRSQVELADRDLNDRANITRMLENLEREGFVERRPDEDDGRRNSVYLTEEGRDLMQGLFPYIVSERKTLFNGFNGEEMNLLDSLLSKLTDNALNG